MNEVISDSSLSKTPANQATPGDSMAARADTSASPWWLKPTTRWIALMVATAIIFYLCWLMIQPFADVLLWAVILAVVFNPVYKKINAKLNSPGWASALTCLLTVALILIPLALVSAAIARDATRMAMAVNEHKSEWLDPNSTSGPGMALRWIDQYVDVDHMRTREYVAQKVQGISSVVASKSLNVVGGVLGVVVQAFFVVFTLFYLFKDGPRIRSAVRDYLPLDQWQSNDVFVRTREVIEASVKGSLVIATVQGVMGGIAFWILGLPSALLWGAVMIVLCMIPMLGAFVVWVPAALYLLATGHWGKAIILAIWGGGVIGTIDNFLRPKLVGDRTRLHELVIFFSVLGGIQVFGVLGLITGPVLAAVAIALVKMWKGSRTSESVIVASA